VPKVLPMKLARTASAASTSEAGLALAIPVALGPGCMLAWKLLAPIPHWAQSCMLIAVVLGFLAAIAAIRHYGMIMVRSWTGVALLTYWACVAWTFVSMHLYMTGAIMASASVRNANAAMTGCGVLSCVLVSAPAVRRWVRLDMGAASQ
jgi:hypothetical protein